MALAIRELAGENYQDACDRALYGRGCLGPTEVVLTGPYQLVGKFKNILHVPIPKRSQLASERESARALKELYGLVFSCGEERGTPLITMTLFGCGSYGHHYLTSMAALLEAAETSLGSCFVDILIPDSRQALVLRDYLTVVGRDAKKDGTQVMTYVVKERETGKVDIERADRPQVTPRGVVSVPSPLCPAPGWPCPMRCGPLEAGRECLWCTHCPQQRLHDSADSDCAVCQRRRCPMCSAYPCEVVTRSSGIIDSGSRNLRLLCVTALQCPVTTPDSSPDYDQGSVADPTHDTDDEFPFDPEIDRPPGVRIRIVPPRPPEQVHIAVPEYMRAHVRPIQERAPNWEVQLWKDRGATKGHDGIWRNHDGRTVAPITLLDTLINCAHDLDHCARGEVKQQILDSGFWAPGLQDRIANVLRDCHICGRNNIRKGIAPRPLGHIPLPEGPFKHITMDYVDMCKKVNNFQYILVVICRYSRWIEACPSAKQDEVTVTRFLTREVIPRFGIPETISSDNGKAFVARVWKRIAQKLRIRVRFGCVYHPQSQGMVERANGTLKNKILKITQSTGLNWVDALPIALMKMRGEKNRNTHLTPHEMLTGRAMPAPMIREGRGPTLEILNREVRLYIRQLSHVHKTIFKEQMRRENRLGRNAEEEERPVEPGDYVYLRVFKRSCLDPRAEGPYKVTQATPRAVRVEGSNLWYHLNSCFRAPRPDGGQEDDDGPGPAPPSPGGGPEEGDDGDEPPGGAGADRRSTEREVQAPDVRPGPSVPRVPRVFSPQSVSAGGDPDEPGPEEQRRPDPATTRTTASPAGTGPATTGTEATAATPVGEEAIPTLSPQTSDGSREDSRGKEAEARWRQETTAVEPGSDTRGSAGEEESPFRRDFDFLTLGDDIWTPDVDQPGGRPFISGGFLEELFDPNIPPMEELFPEFAHTGGDPSTGGPTEQAPTWDHDYHRGAEPEPGTSGTGGHQYSYGGADWGEYEPSSEDDD